MIAKGAVEIAPSSPGFYSLLFVVQKASGSWRPVFERFCPVNTVQDGVKPVCAPVHQELRLDDLHRSQGRVPSGSDSSGQQEVFEICSLRQSLPVQGSLLWPLHCPSSIHKSWLRCHRFSTARASRCYGIWVTG